MHTKVLAAILASGLIAVSACRHGESQVHAAPSIPVQTAAVEEVSGQRTANYSAAVEPDATVDMAFKVDGYVESLLKIGGRNVQEGDFVSKGAVLARVRQSDYQAGLDAARSQASQAAEAINVATWQLSQVEALYKKASFDAERAAALYQERALTKPDYDAALAQLESTRAQVEAARKNVEVQRNLLGSAKAQEQSAVITFGDTALAAPMPAVVLEKRIEPGALVGRGMPAFRLGDVRTVRMAFGVPDTLVTELKLDAILPVRVDALPDEQFEGRIRQIGAAADPATRLYQVEVAIPNPKLQLKTGMMGRVSVPAAEPDFLLPTVPANALLRSPSDPNSASVFVVEGQPENAQARLRIVRIGDFVGSRVTVLSGLTKGEKVVIGGKQNLVDGSPIRVVE